MVIVASVTDLFMTSLPLFKDIAAYRQGKCKIGMGVPKAPVNVEKKEDEEEDEEEEDEEEDDDDDEEEDE